MKEIITFLKELETHNTREWFELNKPRYLMLKKEFEQFVNSLIDRLQHIDSRMSGVTSKGSIFRIYRDTRFSKDKTPYKNNFGAYLVNGGKSSPEPGYYLHFQPGSCFVAGGMYMPPSDQLKAIRKEIYNFPEDYKRIIGTPSFTEYFKLVDEDRLKRAPKGFPDDFELIEVLKYKSYCPFMDFPDGWLNEPDVLEKLVGIYEKMKPFNDFLFRAIHD